MAWCLLAHYGFEPFEVVLLVLLGFWAVGGMSLLGRLILWAAGPWLATPSLATCPVCGHSSREPSGGCPHCGCRL